MIIIIIIHTVARAILGYMKLSIHPRNILNCCQQQSEISTLKHTVGAATLHWATISRATVKWRQFTRLHLTGATINHSDN